MRKARKLINLSSSEDKDDSGKGERRWSFKTLRKPTSTAEEKCIQTADGVVSGVSAVVGTTGAALHIAGGFVRSTAGVTSMFGLFLPLVSEALNLGSEIIKLYQTAEHNKRTCLCLARRVMAAELAIKPLESLGPNKDFFTKDNYKVFQMFVETMRKMKEFIEDISQIKGLSKFQRFKENILKSGAVSRRFVELTEEFDGYMEILQLSLAVDNAIQRQVERKILEEDLAEVQQYLKDIKGGLVTTNDTISMKVEQLYVMNENYQRNEQKPTKSQESQPAIPPMVKDIPPLNIDEFTQVGEQQKRVAKWIRDVDCAEMAFREVNYSMVVVTEADKHADSVATNIATQVKILKMLSGNSPHIIAFYGLAKDNARTYLVTEWAEYGSLHDYYNTTGRTLDWNRKMCFALDICRALTFLQAVNVLHHDVRSDNIMITVNEQAKLANFGLSRMFHEATMNVKANANNVRYMAPEKLKNQEHRYDFKCEMYSFGMLLYEIAMETRPFENEAEDIVKLRRLILNKKRPQWIIKKEKANSQPDVPIEYQNIVERAWDHEAFYRPAFSDVFKLMHSLHRRMLHGESSSDIKADVLPLDQAVKLHYLKGGGESAESAYRSFKFFADLGNVLAKYWKGYYLYYDVLKKGNGEEGKREACLLFKEAADGGNSEAQMRYGSCLFHGNGCPKDIPNAINYFKMAAENTNPTAMYNLYTLFTNKENQYYDEDHGLYWLQRAAINGHAKAQQKCQELGKDKDLGIQIDYD